MQDSVGARLLTCRCAPGASPDGCFWGASVALVGKCLACELCKSRGLRTSHVVHSSAGVCKMGEMAEPASSEREESGQ